jgi:hypothetical protein
VGIRESISGDDLRRRFAALGAVERGDPEPRGRRRDDHDQAEGQGEVTMLVGSACDSDGLLNVREGVRTMRDRKLKDLISDAQVADYGKFRSVSFSVPRYVDGAGQSRGDIRASRGVRKQATAAFRRQHHQDGRHRNKAMVPSGGCQDTPIRDRITTSGVSRSSLGDVHQ